jgi:hypothetical protein
MFPGFLKLLSSSPHEGAGVSNMTFNIIQLVTLSFHKSSHIQEYLVKLNQILLYLLHSIMSLLNF